MNKSFTLVVVLMLTVIILFAGSVSAGDFNYGEVLQKSVYFYMQQRSGDLPDDFPVIWRGDSAVNDGSDVGVDLTGGWYDAGDHVKFNLPMAATATMLAWGVYEYEDAYKDAGLYDEIMDELRFVTDYFIRCHTAPNEYYYQVGDVADDHAWWGPVEVIEEVMERPSFKLDMDNPGSAVVGSTAATLAVSSIIFEETDPEYSEELLQHAIELYDFADATKSDEGYTAHNDCYRSFSGFWDELTWAATWLYLATDDTSYLEKAENYASNLSYEDKDMKWTQNWDDKKLGATLMLAKITGKDKYISNIEYNLDFWQSDGGITYTPGGLAWLDQWGSLRYAANASFLAFVWSDSEYVSESKADKYREFAESQIDYMLGDNPDNFSYVIGFGDDYPQRPHHRTAHGTWVGNLDADFPDEHRHILYGALVGGPDSKDSYNDSIGDYISNEVACDYNAAFTGALAKMYSLYGGQTLDDFPQASDFKKDQDVTPEYMVRAQSSNYSSNSLDIVAYISNRSGWPAQVRENMSFKFFVDFSEVVDAGHDISEVTASVSKSPATISGPHHWEDNVYYYELDFTGEKIYPAGPSESVHRRVSFSITAPVAMDSSNDWSLKKELPETITWDPTTLDGYTEYIPVYDNGELLAGLEPSGGDDSGDDDDGDDGDDDDDGDDTGNDDIVKGDINIDGYIDSIDISLMRRVLLGNKELSADEEEAADMNDDNYIDSIDFTTLRRELTR